MLFDSFALEVWLEVVESTALIFDDDEVAWKGSVGKEGKSGCCFTLCVRV